MSDKITCNRILNVKVCRLKPEYLDFHKFNIKSVIKMPAIVDLRNNMTPIKDQGDLGSCTGFALGALVENFYKKQLINFLASELFIYYNERVLENTIPIDAGALLSDGIKCLKGYGTCSQSLWPYIISKFAIKPPNNCYIDAEKRQALVVKNVIHDLTQMKTCLLHGHPFVIGILIYTSFYNSKSGIIPLPNQSKERLLGGHAVVCVGYDEAKKVFIMRNSWGTSWGNKGYFTIPYAYLLNPRLSSDIWAIITMEK